MLTSLRDSVLHNLGVQAVGFGFALIGRGLDRLCGFDRVRWRGVPAIGWCLVCAGFLVRVWAAAEFYRRRMDVISLVPQHALITTGPFRFSRNPLYLGGNAFTFLGASLVLRSPGAVLLTALNLVLLDRWMIPREERQLALRFGEEWTRYRDRVPRWL